jgi:Transcription initiation factor IIF, alpha subunit (TFIIF-alpha).
MRSHYKIKCGSFITLKSLFSAVCLHVCFVSSFLELEAKKKKKKKDSDDEAFEESDDGDEEGRELDYISDSSERFV